MYIFTAITFVVIYLYYYLFFKSAKFTYHPFENNYHKDQPDFFYEEVFIPTQNGNKLGLVSQKTWQRKKH